MKTKRLLSLLCALMMALAPCAALAADLWGDLFGVFEDDAASYWGSDPGGNDWDAFYDWGEGSDSFSSGDVWSDVFSMFGGDDWSGGSDSWGSSSSYWDEGDSWGSSSYWDEGDSFSSGSDMWGDVFSMFGGSSYGDFGDLFGGYGGLSTYGSVGGGSGSWSATEGEDADFSATGDDDTTWAIYWYLCGSDLESEAGYATDDLSEMMKAQLPDNVTVVIQTGGARRWRNNFVSNSKLQRWVYHGGELRLVAEEANASMGNPRTLAAFLDFCDRNFPADRRAVVFWNHGGGSVAGVAFDQNYSNDALTLSEMHTAFTAVFDKDESDPPLEMVCFDACLMASVDVAYTFHGLASYLVASEETEPGTGWDYEAWLGRLGDDPGMSGAQLGRIICDTYAKSCQSSGEQGTVTLSVTDLSLADELVYAYEVFGVDALRAATTDRGFFNRFARAAARSENYGGNSRDQGYTNMVDLGHLARLTLDMLPSAQGVLDALDDCVLYRVNGSYRAEATGLSCYYSYSGSVSELNQYLQEGAGDAFACYNLYGLTGQLPQQGMSYLQQPLPTPPSATAAPATPAPALPSQPVTALSLPDMGWDDMPLSIDDDGAAWLELGPLANDVLATVTFQLYRIDEDEDVMLWLGSDNDLSGSWEDGVFRDNFRGVWGALDGHLVFMELTFEGDDYNLYAVPVKLNGEVCHLQIAYDFVSEQWSILGARQGLEDNGMAQSVRLLRKGDDVTILWYANRWSSTSDDFDIVERETIRIGSSLEFSEEALPDGMYAMLFEMSDAQGNCAYSEPVLFECSRGEIYTIVE